jgi:hypothetical protein
MEEKIRTLIKSIKVEREILEAEVKAKQSTCNKLLLIELDLEKIIEEHEEK